MEKCGECGFFNEADGHCRRNARYIGFFNDSCPQFVTPDDQKKEISSFRPIEKRKKRKAMTQTTFTCSTCGQTKPLEDFHKNRWGATKICEECFRAKCSRNNKKPCEDQAPAKKAVSPSTTPANPEAPALRDATDAQLVDELKRRGYTGTIQKTFIFVTDK